ncbi:prolactin receptor a [Gasterosteus aculeatus]
MLRLPRASPLVRLVSLSSRLTGCASRRERALLGAAAGVHHGRGTEGRETGKTLLWLPLSGAKMRNVFEVMLLLLLLLLPLVTAHAGGQPNSPPGKPVLTSCRSPEKETFTCWWKPGSDGGLSTKHSLFYRKESSDAVHECPDYRTAGENSCFFNKNNTAIWVNYNITVVATNSLGSAYSDPVEVDVVYIVQPNPPENVTVSVMEDKGWPFLRVSWEPPRKADTRSGWITLVYELRVKLKEEDDWETHLAGQQKMFNILSLPSGGEYQVEVRCRPDHGFWSEWSSTSKANVPHHFRRDNSTWILMTVFFAFTFLIVAWLLHLNRHNLKRCILPPVPGPKIKGFDKKLLKSGKSNEIFSALVVPDYPSTPSSNYEDLLVDYLEVYVPTERELQLEESKDPHNDRLKSDSSTSDSDSGRGSCDSHTLLVDKEAKEEARQVECGQTRTEVQRSLKDWDALTYAQIDMVGRDVPSGRVKTWPSLYSPLPRHSSGPLDQQSSLQMAKQHSLSTSSFLAQEASGESYWDVCSHGELPRPLRAKTPPHRGLRARSDADVSGAGLKRAPAGPRSLAPHTSEYVEVQRVNNKDVVLLQPVVTGCYQALPGEVYSKVKRVDSDNILLLQREAREEDGYPGAEQENTTQKPSACVYAAVLVQDQMAPMVNAYVDTATMCTLTC